MDQTPLCNLDGHAGQNRRRADGPGGSGRGPGVRAAGAGPALRLCLLSECFYPEDSGGTPVVVSHLARYLQDHYTDLTIDVVASKNLYRTHVDAPLAREEEWQGIRITRLPTPRSHDRSLPVRFLLGTGFSLAALRELLRRPRYDLVLVVTSPPSLPLAAQAYRRLRGVPYVYLMHDLYPDIAVGLGRLSAGSPVTRLCRRVQRGWLHGAARVVAIGRCMQARLQAGYGLGEDRIEVIPNWADPDQIVPLPKDTAYRARHGLEGFVVLYAGGFGQSVDFDCLLAAAALLPDITFALVGDGEKEHALRVGILARELRNVRVLPRVPQCEVAEVLASADVSLVPLDPRIVGLGVPSKLHSVLASGRPAIGIVPSESEVAHVLTEHECGLVAPPGDPFALAQAVRRLQADPVAATRMGRSARRALEEHYTLQRAAARFYALFHAVAAREASLPSAASGVSAATTAAEAER